MRSRRTVTPHSPPEGGFSIVGGGPAHRIQQRLGLIRPESQGLARRAALFALVTWVPAFILSAAEGTALGGGVRIPFLYDFHVHALLLVAGPLLFVAEGLIHFRLPRVTAHFIEAGLVGDRDRRGFESALERAATWRDSTLAEIVLLGLTAVGVAVALYEFPFGFSTWRSIVSGQAHTRTLAGWWLLLVGAPLFQFLFWRWHWRLLIWYRFLWHVSRLGLRLIPTHADRAAGLGFLGDAQRYFWIIVVAVSTPISGALADEIVYTGVPLASYTYVIAGYVAYMLLIFLGPLIMFAPQMSRAKIRCELDYSALVVRHNQMFDAKWIQGDGADSGSVLGAPDMSSLADLGSAYRDLRRMRAIPFDPADALVLALATLLPMAPLLLTVYPLDDLLRMLWKVLV